MSWNATLEIDYTRQAKKTVAHSRHSGPLRILRSMYPEGDGICHNVVVHPPGGLVGGDTLDIKVSVAADAYGLITTPGAARFYRSGGEPALQRTRLSLAAGARLEWLPLESLCYSGCIAENRLQMHLAPGAELMGWDVTALGLPAAGKPFDLGNFCQHIEFPGVWLERANIKAADTLLLNSPVGLDGQRCIGTLFFVAGSKLERRRRQEALDRAREVIKSNPLHASAGATSPDGRVVVVRVLAPVVEPAFELLKEVWKAWRSHFWNHTAELPRIWAT